MITEIQRNPFATGWDLYDIREKKFVIDETQAGPCKWRVAKPEEAGLLHMKSTLFHVNKRCEEIVRHTLLNPETKEGQNILTKEMELHLQHSLYFLKKVHAHVDRKWAWLPFLGRLFAMIGKAQVTEAFVPLFDLLQLYLHVHATHVLAVKADELQRFSLQKEYKALVSHYREDVRYQDVLFPEEKKNERAAYEEITCVRFSERAYLSPVQRHIQNLFDHGAPFGFFKDELCSKGEAEELLKENKGSCDTEGNQILFWRKQEQKDSFEIFCREAKSGRSLAITMNIYDRGAFFLYEAATSFGFVAPPLLITKELPDFPEHSVGHSLFSQSKMHFIRDVILGIAHRV